MLHILNISFILLVQLRHQCFEDIKLLVVHTVRCFILCVRRLCISKITLHDAQCTFDVKIQCMIVRILVHVGVHA